jgi:hypothetical protein
MEAKDQPDSGMLFPTSSSATLKLPVASGQNDSGMQFCNTLIQKYSKSIQSKIENVCSNSDWVYTWLFINLGEWELTNQLKHGLHSKRQEGLVPDVDHRIKKVRERLFFLQTQMVINEFLA